MKKSVVTMKDIANITGFSIQTVSRVLNGSQKVKSQTKKIIEDAIKEYEYKPNIFARNLSGPKKNRNILISVRGNVSHTATIWLNLLISRIITLNKDENVSIFMEQYYDEFDFKRSLLNRSSTFIDGVIIFYEEKNDKRIELLKKENIPYIIYGQSYNKDDVYVAIDSKNSIMIGAEYLFERGMKKILFITANPSPVNNEREKGITGAYLKNNIDLSNLRIIKFINNQEQVYNLVKELYRKKELPEALFISGDEKAIGALKALYDLGIKVPEEISVMGFDDIPISRYFSPALSTVSFDYDIIAKKLLKKIKNLIDDKEEISEEIPGKLIIRESIK